MLRDKVRGAEGKKRRTSHVEAKGSVAKEGRKEDAVSGARVCEDSPYAPTKKGKGDIYRRCRPMAKMRSPLKKKEGHSIRKKKD